MRFLWFLGFIPLVLSANSGPSASDDEFRSAREELEYLKEALNQGEQEQGWRQELDDLLLSGEPADERSLSKPTAKQEIPKELLEEFEKTSPPEHYDPDQEFGNVAKEMSREDERKLSKMLDQEFGEMINNEQKDAVSTKRAGIEKAEHREEKPIKLKSALRRKRPE